MAAGTKPGYKVGKDESGLTKREREVLGLIVKGLNGPQIGESLGITKQRVDQIMRVLVAKGRVQKRADSFVVLPVGAEVVVPRGGDDG